MFESIKQQKIEMNKKLLENPFFTDWFNESQAIDGNGRPLKLYHGTNQNITTFRADRLGLNTRSASASAFFFTESILEATEYAEMSARTQVSNSIEQEANAERLLKAIDQAFNRGDFDLGEKLTLELEESEQEAMSGEECGANIMPVYLSIQNLLVVDMSGLIDLHKMQEHIDYARENGFGGLKFLNVFDPVGKYKRENSFETTQWAVFEPSQIISAICPLEDLEKISNQDNDALAHRRKMKFT